MKRCETMSGGRKTALISLLTLIALPAIGGCDAVTKGLTAGVTDGVAIIVEDLLQSSFAPED